jgi:hypothetical protein
VDGLKRKHKHQIKKTMSNFQLNFNSPKKVVSITLDEEEGIFQLAYLFKKLLDDAGIPNKLEEKEVEEPEVLQQVNEKLD